MNFKIAGPSRALGYALALCTFVEMSSAVSRTDKVCNRDGSHDFDFALGLWKASISRRLHPLSGSTVWAHYTGRTSVTPVWNGRAELVQLEADGSAGHIEFLSLRLYNPQKCEWSLYYANSADGTLSPPVTGSFSSSRGEFHGHDRLNNRPILVRQVISATANSLHLEQAFSADHGHSWEVNFVETLTRLKADSDGIAGNPKKS